MAIDSTLFVCKPHELLDAFPGWRLPLPEPVKREFQNPFTGEVNIIETRAPEWSDKEEELFKRQYQLLSTPTKDEDDLNAKMVSFVRSCPHWTAYSVDVTELGELAQLTGASDWLEQPLFAPPSACSMLMQFAAETTSLLASLDQRGLEELAFQWAARMSTPEYTLSAADCWDAAQALKILQLIVNLAQQAIDEKVLYVLMESN